MINKSAGDILGDYLNNPGLKLLFKIGDAIGGLPSATPGHVEPQFVHPRRDEQRRRRRSQGWRATRGRPQWHAHQWELRAVPRASPTLLKNNFYLSIPVLDNPSGSIIKILTGKDVDLVQFNPGLVSLTEGYQLPEISVPIASLGVASVYAFISGARDRDAVRQHQPWPEHARAARWKRSAAAGRTSSTGSTSTTAQYQAGINLSANLKLGGSVSVFGYDAVQLYGQFSAFGQFGVHVNDVAYNATTHLPIGTSPTTPATPPATTARTSTRSPTSPTTSGRYARSCHWVSWV